MTRSFFKGLTARIAAGASKAWHTAVIIMGFALVMAAAMATPAAAQTISSGTCAGCVAPTPTNILTISAQSTIESAAVGQGAFKTVDPTGKGVSSGIADGFSNENFNVYSSGTLAVDPGCVVLGCGEQRFTWGFNTHQQVGGLAVGTFKLEGVPGGIEGGASASTGTAARGTIGATINLTVPAPVALPGGKG